MGTMVHKLQNFRTHKTAEIHYVPGGATLPYRVDFYTGEKLNYTLHYADEATALLNAQLHCK